MSKTTNLFSAPIAEYKTKKAAEKFAKRVIGGAQVRPSKTSAFDMYWPENKVCWQVFPDGAMS